MEHHLVGGGWTPRGVPAVYGAFLEAAGHEPEVACVLLQEEGVTDDDARADVARWTAALRTVAPCEPRPVLVPEGGVLDVADLGDAAALLVCGGLTPAYAAALGPVAEEVRGWLGGTRPYAGFSAGSAIAAGRALVGGWRAGGRPVCSEDAGEDLDEVTVVPGLGLVPFAVDVHCAQWGTLSRVVAAVAGRQVDLAVGIDEDTALVVDGPRVRVTGLGNAYVVRGTPGGAEVAVLAPGASGTLG